MPRHQGRDFTANLKIEIQLRAWKLWMEMPMSRDSALKAPTDYLIPVEKDALVWRDKVQGCLESSPNASVHACAI